MLFFPNKLLRLMPQESLHELKRRTSKRIQIKLLQLEEQRLSDLDSEQPQEVDEKSLIKEPPKI